MNARSLEGFIAIVNTGSFTAAADSLYISQSALSQQIRALEAQIGVRLFNRAANRATLTAAGQDFYPKAQNIVALYRDAVHDARLAAYSERVQDSFVFFGCTDAEFFRLWLDLFDFTASIRDRPPLLATRLPSREKVYQALTGGKVAFTLQLESAEIAEGGFEFAPLCRVPEYCVAVHPRFLPQRDALSLEDTAGCRLVFHHAPGYTVYEDALRAAARATPDAPSEDSEFFDEEFGRPLLTLLPASEYPRTDRRYALPLQWGEGHRMGFVYRPDVSAPVRRFLEETQELAAQQGSPFAF
jgi:DNA-binding transcriptional LysR family regulator